MTTNKPELTDRRRLITGSVSTLLNLALCLFVPAGTWAWFWGWLVVVVVVAASVVISLRLWRVNPEVVAARIGELDSRRGYGLFGPFDMKCQPGSLLI
jgi:hypothetical protein